MFGLVLFIGGPEIFFIALIILLLFGADKIPEIAKGLGKGMHEFRKAADDIKREMNNHTSDMAKDIGEVEEQIKETKDELKDKI